MGVQTNFVQIIFCFVKRITWSQSGQSIWMSMPNHILVQPYIWLCTMRTQFKLFLNHSRRNIWWLVTNSKPFLTRKHITKPPTCLWYRTKRSNIPVCLPGSKNPLEKVLISLFQRFASRPTLRLANPKEVQ